MFARNIWSLKAVNWWGGWTDGERTGTIMRYLLVEYAQYEAGYSNMLSPERYDSRHAAFKGEAAIDATEPVTQRSMNTEPRSMEASIKLVVNKELAAHRHKPREDMNEMAAMIIEQVGLTVSNLFASRPTPGLPVVPNVSTNPTANTSTNPNYHSRRQTFGETWTYASP